MKNCTCIQCICACITVTRRINQMPWVPYHTDFISLVVFVALGWYKPQIKLTVIFTWSHHRSLAHFIMILRSLLLELSPTVLEWKRHLNCCAMLLLVMFHQTSLALHWEYYYLYHVCELWPIRLLHIKWINLIDTCIETYSLDLATCYWFFYWHSSCCEFAMQH